jgi:Holliday junction resolvasome RuvABC ATP-dependent DNA helicase subunit
MSKVVLGKHGLHDADEDLCLQIAMAGNNNPRAMRQVLNTLLDIALVEGGDYDIKATLDMMEITPDGLTLTMRKYLTVLHDNFEGAAGASALTSVMQEPGGLAEVERVLQNKGYIVLTKQGRQLTDRGVHRAQAVKRGESYGFAS